MSFSISAHVKKTSLRVKDIGVTPASASADMARRGPTAGTVLRLLLLACAAAIRSIRAEAAVNGTVGWHGGGGLPRCVPIDGGVFEGDLLSQPGGCCTSKPTICRSVYLDR